MKIVFFGTSEFAVPSLNELISSGHEVMALVTQPDRQKGRNLKLSPPVTKVHAVTRNIPVYQPLNASSPESAAYLRNLKADLFIVVSFGQILKKEILSIPKLYTINLHGSLLPRYRGASPTNRAIMNGDSHSGVTIIRLNEKMDEGDIMLKCEIEIDPGDTNITLHEKLSELGAKSLLEMLELIENGKVEFVKQDPALATYAHKLKKEDGLINWTENSTTICNKVRGLLPWPGAYTHYDGKILKVLQAEVFETGTDTHEAAGTVIGIIKNKGIIVKAGRGSVVIRYLQQEGKKPLDAESFLRGHKLPIGYQFV